MSKFLLDVVLLSKVYTRFLTLCFIVLGLLAILFFANNNLFLIRSYFDVVNKMFVFCNVLFILLSIKLLLSQIIFLLSSDIRSGILLRPASNQGVSGAPSGALSFLSFLGLFLGEVATELASSLFLRSMVLGT